MTIRSASVTALVTSIAALMGCSSGGSSSSTGTTTCASPGGLGSMPIAQLTPAQRATVCSDFQSCASVPPGTLTPAIQLTCRTLAISYAALAGAQTDAALRQLCQQIYDSCIGEDGGGFAAGGGDAGSPSNQCNAAVSQAAPGCTATVDQFFQCINDSDSANATAVQVALQATPACSAVTLASLLVAADAGAAFIQQPATPASCMALQSCPLLSGGGDGGLGP